MFQTSIGAGEFLEEVTTNPIANLLWYFGFGEFEASEPRDIVYAILGLLPKDRNCTEGAARLLTIDYSKPVSAVMKDATRYALCNDSDMGFPYPLRLLEPISHCRDTGRFPGIPSWALKPDYDWGNRSTITPNWPLLYVLGY